MKTILEINTTNYGSTGTITLNIAKKARENGFKVYTACKNANESQKYKYEDHIYIGNRYDRIISEELAYITGLRGYFNILNTKSFLKEVDKIKPDLVHLHVLHDTFINLTLLFKYLKKHNIPVIWTFHDCWTLTGQCPAFEMVGCNKWISGCHHCPQTKVVPKSLFLDTTKHIWNKQKKLFTSLDDITIVTPSNWLHEQVSKSFFNKYPIKTIYNGINLDIFKPINSNFKQKHNIEDKYLVLGIANIWEERKGLDKFIWLSKNLPKNYQIVLVGTNDEVDKILPDNIISIHRTYNVQELVEIYNAADIYVNPTLEDVFGLVNVEALACATPVIVYKTGGCTEIIENQNCGYVIERNSKQQLLSSIIDICENKPFTKENCLKRAKDFEVNKNYEQYINLYKTKLGEN